jgi:hypothetical protein
MDRQKPTLSRGATVLIIGGAKSPHDKTLFHKLSLIAFFAWIGLGADGRTSSFLGSGSSIIHVRSST